MYQDYLKRFLDFICALLALILLSPIFLVIAVLIYIYTGNNPFFYQKRPGKGERIFTIIKFKTMNDKRDNIGNLLSDEERLTGIGKLIRKTSLDEIPQLFNVLLGDMSFVGPRPLLPEYLSLYTIEENKRHDVRPGITGWAQVNGRNIITWKKKLALDIYYVDNLNIILDIKIFLLTLVKVVKSEGVSSNSHITKEKFDGTN